MGFQSWKEPFENEGTKLREEKWLAQDWRQPGEAVSPPSLGGMGTPSSLKSKMSQGSEQLYLGGLCFVL